MKRLPSWYIMMVSGIIVAVFAAVELSRRTVDQYLGVALLSVIASVAAVGYAAGKKGNGNGGSSA